MTAEALVSTTGAAVPKRQAEELVNRAAGDFDAFNGERETDSLQADTGPLMVLTVDGKGVVIRREDQREATREAAESATLRGQKGEQPGRRQSRAKRS